MIQHVIVHKKKKWEEQGRARVKAEKEGTVC